MIDTDEIVTLRLPAKARFIRTARLVAAGLANELDLDLDGLDDVRLAVGEVCALATQFGAVAIDLEFILTDGHLQVRGGGTSNGSNQTVDTPVDDDQIRLVQQILDVACAEHGITRTDGELRFSLTFVHGS